MITLAALFWSFCRRSLSPLLHVSQIKRFEHASPSLCVQLQHTDYHVLYTTSKFEAATTTTLNYILQPLTIFNPVFISILKLYTFHTMDNRKHFFRNYLV